MTLRYYQKLATPAGATANAILAGSPDVYLYGCLIEAAIFTQDAEAALRYLPLYNASVAGLNARMQRITAAFSEGADDLIIAAAAVSAEVGASLRVASFAVRAHPPLTAGIGSSPERAVIHQWVQDMRAAAAVALEPVEDLATRPADIEYVIGHGTSWEEALEEIEWDDGDVLMVGSSTIGQIARVFLGSRAWKIVRNSPVPVVVVPRRAAAELAEEAVQGIA